MRFFFLRKLFVCEIVFMMVIWVNYRELMVVIIFLFLGIIVDEVDNI